MRIVFAGGGTAGHLTPALSLAEALQKNYPGCEIAFGVSPNGIEGRLLEREPYRTFEVPIYPLTRTLSRKTLQACASIHGAVKKSGQFLRMFQPDFVIGTGGYVTYPVIRAAQKLGIPNFLHESNAVPGLSLKLLARRANCVFLNFAGAAEGLPRGVETKTVGNFIRASGNVLPVASIRRELRIADGDLFVLVTGGSLGAQRINSAIVTLGGDEEVQKTGVHFVVSTGKEKYEAVKTAFLAKYGHLPRNIHIFPYISEMEAYWQACDIAICRAGACTLSELSQAGKPAIIVPYPHATRNHQSKNAAVFGSSEAAFVLDDAQLTAETLKKHLLLLAASPALRHRMGAKAKRLLPVNRFSLLFDTVFLSI